MPTAGWGDRGDRDRSVSAEGQCESKDHPAVGTSTPEGGSERDALAHADVEQVRAGSAALPVSQPSGAANWETERKRAAAGEPQNQCEWREMTLAATAGERFAQGRDSGTESCTEGRRLPTTMKLCSRILSVTHHQCYHFESLILASNVA